MSRAVIYGSACPACRQAKEILERVGLPYDARPLDQLPAAFGRVRHQPQIELDGIPLGGIDQLLRLVQSPTLADLVAGVPYQPEQRRQRRWFARAAQPDESHP